MSLLINADYLRSLLITDCDVDPQILGEEEALQVLSARELLLLRQTLEYVECFVPYYRDLFKQDGFKADSFQCLSDTLNLPVLTKATVVSHLNEFISQEPGLAINSVVSTSGTTSSIRLPRFICNEEIEACALLSRITRGSQKPKTERDILLRIFPTMRRFMGVTQHSHFPEIIVTLSLHTPKYSIHRSNYDDFVLKQLFEKFPIPGTAGYVTVVHTTPPFLIRIISDDLKARSLSPSDTHLRCIACTGGLITNRILQLIKDFWQVPLLTSYSMSELNGYAVGCDLYPNRYHFDTTVYAEVIDPVTYQPIAEGQEGLLLVTSLYPFQQAQPFIRYNTGDIVAYVGRRCECGVVGTSIEYRGRIDHCLDLRDVLPTGVGKRFLASADIHDVLEDIPEIPSILYPRFEVTRLDKDGLINLQLTTEVYQITSANMMADLKAQILAKILARYPELARLREQKRLSLDIHLCNSGEMQSFYRLYPDA